jgi:hypothetical protein
MSNHDQQLADLQSQIEHLLLRLAVAVDGEAVALAALALARQQAAFSTALLSAQEADMQAANEPDPDAKLPVMPGRALRRQHTPGGLWPPI